MKPKIFMSYSRRELGFVDDLTYQLEKAGFNVWLDYRVLIPGSPWAVQIEKGLNECDVIVLVVSKASLASQYVELEWRKVMQQNKRVILALFEAVDLPTELENVEWVDFRGNYKTGIRELISQLQTPTAEKYRTPEKGVKIPSAVWAAVILAACAGFFSLFAFWSILLPIILVPLAKRILTRDYNFQNVQNALWALPFSVLMSSPLLYDITQAVTPTGVDQSSSITSNVLFYFILLPAFTTLTSIALAFLLRSPAMQRWGKPEALMPKFANPYRPNNPNPKPVSFFIDHAPQDKRMATELAKTLIRYKHTATTDIHSAEAVFVLVSRFKSDTEADPEQQVVFPLLVQTAQASEKLLHMQWIDFRKGARNMDAIAQLLPNPANMLKAIGVRPADGRQVITPGVITSLVNFLAFYAALTFTSYPIYLWQLYSKGVLAYWSNSSLGVASTLIQQGIASLATCVICYFMVTSLIQRAGSIASLGRFITANILLFILMVWITAAGGAMNVQLATVGAALEDAFDALPAYFYIFIGSIIGLGALFRVRDLIRWFPTSNTHTK